MNRRPSSARMRIGNKRCWGAFVVVLTLYVYITSAHHVAAQSPNLVRGLYSKSGRATSAILVPIGWTDDIARRPNAPECTKSHKIQKVSGTINRYPSIRRRAVIHTGGGTCSWKWAGRVSGINGCWECGGQTCNWDEGRRDTSNRPLDTSKERVSTKYIFQPMQQIRAVLLCNLILWFFLIILCMSFH